MFLSRPTIHLAAILPLAVVLSACNAAAVTRQDFNPTHPSMPPPKVGETEAYQPPRVLDLAAVTDIEGLIPALASKRVVFVGESHDRYDHHLNQLEIVRGLHTRDPRIAIGMEFFQQPFQAQLDAFIAGEIDERTFLRETEYFDRWRFDYRLYKPILDFARQHRVPVLALNVPRELTDQISAKGLDGLDSETRAHLPAEIDRSSEAYRRRLEAVFKQHPTTGEGRFERFMDVQLAWDEGMAERAARFLRENPEMRLVVLAGSGHVAYGDGIPKRLLRRIQVPSTIVLNGSDGPPGPDLADYLLLAREIVLPPAGRLGAFLDTSGDGVRVASMSEDSAAAAAGIANGDVLVAIDDQPIERYVDVRLAMWDKRPGDTVTVLVRREGWLRGAREIAYRVNLR